MDDDITSNLDSEPEFEPDFPEETPVRSGSKAGTIILTILAIAGIAGAGAFGWLWNDTQKKSLAKDAQIQELGTNVNALENLRDDLQGQLTDVQSELQRERTERIKEREQLLAESREKLQRTYAQFNEIVYDSRKTLEYIGSVEEKLKTGQKLDSQEAEKLQSVVSGLTFLHKQYEKPIHEFRELERYLSEQLAVPAMVPPKERYNFFQRIFDKEFKQERAQYYREEGQRQAFDRARNKVGQAYARAQSQMKALTLDSTKFLDQLQGIVKSNEASVGDVDDFFSKSREILQIHERIMNIEPESGLQGVKP